MTRLIRADMYRIFRSKAIYISFAVMVAFVFLLINSHNNGTTFGIHFTMEDGLEEITAAALTGAVAAQLILHNMGELVFMLLPVMMTVAMAAFSSGAVKNEFSTGLNRTQFYLAKWMTAAILCIALTVLYMVFAVASAAVSHGMGDWGHGVLGNVAGAFGMQMLFVLAFNSVGMFLCFITRKSAAVTGIYIAIALVPPVVMALLHGAFPAFAEAYVNYDLWLQLTIFAQMANRTGMEIARGLAVGVAYLTIPLAAGIALFKRAEIK